MVRTSLLGIAAVVVVVALAGCGAHGPEAPASMGKIIEYAGDGGGSLKPPAPFAATAEMNTRAAVGDLLPTASSALSRAVPAYNTAWFRIAPRGTAQTVVVTLQPTADEDSDLYVLNRFGYALLGSSVRFPSGGSDSIRGAFAPDWVAVELPASGSMPMAHVAVYGVGGGAAFKHFRVEADTAQVIAATGGTRTGAVGAGQSVWYRLEVYTGDPYNVYLTAVTGDPDLFVYRQTSSGWVGSDVSVGNGTVSFTAGAGPYYIRVYGFSKSDYSLYVQDV